MTTEFLDYTDGQDRHYHDMLGYRMTEWDARHVRLEMDVKPIHRQRGTYTHGGILMGLLDIAAMLSGIHGRRGQVQTLTLSLSTSFIAAVHSKRLAAIGTLTHAGKAVYFAESRVIDIATDTLLATAQGTFRVRPRKETGPGMPPGEPTGA